MAKTFASFRTLECGIQYNTDGQTPSGHENDSSFQSNWFQAKKGRK